MANEYDTFQFLEDQCATKILSKENRRHLREEWNPFSLENTEFTKRYLLTKELAQNLCHELRPLLKDPKKSKGLSIDTKVLTALSFYATGSYQRPVGNMECHSMAQQTVSSVISEITDALNSIYMREKYITFPANSQDRTRIKVEFYNKFQISGVLVCIDGTHVAIVRPKINEERYYSRKHYHSLNVQLICDANMQIISVDASHCGANHDSFIWAQHPIKTHLEELFNLEKNWLLGDSGYPLRRTLITPFLNATLETPEAYYTNLHMRARNCVERTSRLLKACIRCLMVHRVLHYSPEVAGLIVNACVILHNICNKANAPVDQLSDAEVNQEALSQLVNTEAQPVSTTNIRLQQGYTALNALIQQVWERRHITRD